MKVPCNLLQMDAHSVIDTNSFQKPYKLPIYLLLYSSYYYGVGGNEFLTHELLDPITIATMLLAREVLRLLNVYL